MQDLANLISGSEQINASFIFEDHTEGLSDFSVDFKNDNHVYVTSFDSTISLYDIKSTKSVAILKGHSKGVWTCSTNPHSNLLVSGGNDNVIFVWDINSHKPIDQIHEHNEVVYDVQFASNGKHFASCSKGKICLWDIANLKEPIRILDSLSDTNKNTKGKNGFIYCLNFINNDTRLISGYMDGTILIHDIANNTNEMYSIEHNKRFEVENELADSLKEYNDSIYSLSKCKDQEKILLAHSDGSVRIYQTKNKAFELENSVQCKLLIKSYLFHH